MQQGIANALESKTTRNTPVIEQVGFNFTLQQEKALAIELWGSREN